MEYSDGLVALAPLNVFLLESLVSLAENLPESARAIGQPPCCTLSNTCQRKVHSPSHLLTKPSRNCLACDLRVNVVISGQSPQCSHANNLFEVLTQSVTVFTRAWAVCTHPTW